MQIANEPLRKVTLNLFDADMEWLQKRYGYGVSEVIRNQVRKYVKQIKDEEDDKSR